MGRFENLRERNEEVMEKEIATIEGIDEIARESKKVASVAKDVHFIVQDLDKQFEQSTKLNGMDITFLFFATALQCVRQYVIGTLTQRTNDKEAAKRVKGDFKEHSNRHHQLYKPTLEEVKTNPVPFDAISGSKKFGLNIGGGFTHRARTLGHDPILGWIFGTMNIATSTVTVSEGLASYHVLTGTAANGTQRDWISLHADTLKVLLYSKDKLFNEGDYGRQIMGVALLHEAMHLKSDLYSTVSLPAPIISAISVESAQRLSEFGIDMGNIVKVSNQMGYAMLINSFIGMIHGLYFDESQYGSWSLYAVKTRRILMYSNIIASVSNVIAVAVSSALGMAAGNGKVVRESLNYLDIGGIMVMIYRIVNDKKFIQEIKKEFIQEEFYQRVIN